MKQKEFAALVRMGFENYNKVERGSPLTARRQFRLAWRGAWPDSLRKPSKLNGLWNAPSLYCGRFCRCLNLGKAKSAHLV